MTQSKAGTLVSTLLTGVIHLKERWGEREMG